MDLVESNDNERAGHRSPWDRPRPVWLILESRNPARPLDSRGRGEGTVHVVVGGGRLVVGDCGVGDRRGAGGVEEESAAGPLAGNGDEAVGAVADQPEGAGAGARPADVGQAAEP